MTLMVKEWTLFLDRCLEHRIRPDLFDTAAAQLHAKSPLPGRKIAALLLRPRDASAGSVDPRVVTYLERLLALKKVDASDVLASAFQYSKDRLPKTGANEPAKDAEWHNPPELEEIVFHRLSKGFQAEERPLNNSEGLRTLIVMTQWMRVMVTSHTSDTMIQAMAGIQQQPQQQSINVREGLGMLVVGVVENPKMLHILNDSKCTGRLFNASVASFAHWPRSPQELRPVVDFFHLIPLP
jgi:mediator of RNA polymerase II transcription subunit 5